MGASSLHVLKGINLTIEEGELVANDPFIRQIHFTEYSWDVR